MGLLLAALVNAMPSDVACHPTKTAGDFDEGDIAGSGRELPTLEVVSRASARDDTEDRDGRYWRAMAQRCRNLALWHTDDARRRLLDLAEEYERRARDADTREA